jgi:nifR3 family TIM-barrel protein
MKTILSISEISLPIPCLLAPMSGISDLPFRMINRSFGAPFAFAEMIDVNALGLLDKRTMHMLSTNPDDRPLGIQLLASDNKEIGKAIKKLEFIKYDLLDFNAACPTPKVVRKGKGAYLLREPRKLKEILEAIVKNVEVPVTVKIRSGWDDSSINAREIALYAEDAGIRALFIHGRTKTQGYGGTVDYGTITKVKEALRIPVIASGDNLSIPKIKKMFDITGCDGVIIARGSFGNPWIFKDMIKFCKDGSTGEVPDIGARVKVMKEHLHLLISHYGEKRGMSVFRKFVIWYTRGIGKTRTLRDRAFRAEKLEDINEIIDEFNSLENATKNIFSSFTVVENDTTAGLY